MSPFDMKLNSIKDQTNRDTFAVHRPDYNYLAGYARNVIKITSHDIYVDK